MSGLAIAHNQVLMPPGSFVNRHSIMLKQMEGHSMSA
jgi:hypothetical protein